MKIEPKNSKGERVECWVYKLMENGREIERRRFPRMTDAAEARDVRLDEMEAADRRADAVSVGDLVERWLAHKHSGVEKELDDDTIADDLLVASYLPEWLTKMSVEEVEWDHCAEFVGGLAYAQRTRARALSLVQASWVHAMRPRGSTIPAYPWTGFVVSVKRKKPNELGEDEAFRLWDEAAAYAARANRRSQGPRDLSMLALMMWCGLRVGEALCVRVGNVHSDHVWLVCHWKTKGKGKCTPGLKGDTEGTRLVPLFGPAAEVVPAWAAHRREQGASRNSFLHVTYKNELRPVAYRNYRRGLEARAAAVGITDLRPHRLRDTAATAMATAGIGINASAEILGHADISTTGTYTGVRPEVYDGARAAMAAYLGR